MVIFCADSSGSDLSFALVNKDTEREKLLTSVSHSAGGKMNELFFPLLKLFFAENALSAKDIDQWTVITGPGSFTGIRIGMAALGGICAALGKELVGLSALDAAAIVYGKKQVTTAAKLRMNEYAYRSYDFDIAEYSPVEVSLINELPVNSVIIEKSGLNLATAVAYSDSGQFISEATLLYVKRSEAEINFDKKSNHQ